MTKRLLFFPFLLFCFIQTHGQDNAIQVGESDLYVAKYDELNKMERFQAISTCGKKGEGWHLPSVDEMLTIQPFALQLGLDPKLSYWTNTPVLGTTKFYDYNFENNKTHKSSGSSKRYVRCVYKEK